MRQYQWTQPMGGTLKDEDEYGIWKDESTGRRLFVMIKPILQIFKSHDIPYVDNEPPLITCPLLIEQLKELRKNLKDQKRGTND